MKKTEIEKKIKDVAGRYGMKISNGKLRIHKRWYISIPTKKITKIESDEITCDINFTTGYCSVFKYVDHISCGIF